MAKPLVFMMGRFPAFLPADRGYLPNHMWLAEEGGERRFGLTSFAVRLLGDIHHLGWSAAIGSRLKTGESIGYIEASKATSELFAPLGGRLSRLNAEAAARPTLMNTNLYDRGWLLAMTDVEGAAMSPQQYVEYLGQVWPVAQRLLKGQVDARSNKTHQADLS